jgi:hypothetical protein
MKFDAVSEMVIQRFVLIRFNALVLSDIRAQGTCQEDCLMQIGLNGPKYIHSFEIIEFDREDKIDSPSGTARKQANRVPMDLEENRIQ